MLIHMLVVLAVVKADWYHDSLAKELNAENIDEVIGKDNHIILDFFTPWCMYCQYMVHDWNRVYEHYNGAEAKRSDIIIAKLNCGDQQNHPTCHRFGVRSFPTIIHIKPHETAASSHFEGNRNFNDFVKWIDEHCPEPPREESLDFLTTLNQTIHNYQALIKNTEATHTRLKQLNEQLLLQQNTHTKQYAYFVAGLFVGLLTAVIAIKWKQPMEEEQNSV